jgi:hypothetical protein
MRGLSSAIRHAAACLAATIALIGLATSPVAAATEHVVDIRGTAVCDAVAGEWVVTWAVTNRSEVAGTLGNVRVYPAGRPLVGMPNRVQPGETINGVQRLLANEYTGSIIIDINWDDGVVTYDHWWPIYIRTTCRA